MDGVLGIGKMYENAVLPKKRTKGKPLTILEKANNKVISSVRVVSEHTMAGIRKYRSNYDKMRNKIGRFMDDLVWVVSGLHNFHIRELELT